MFGHATGQRVLEDLKQLFHYDTGTYRPGMKGIDLAYDEGQRSVILWLLATVEAALENPDEVLPTTTAGEPAEGTE